MQAHSTQAATSGDEDYVTEHGFPTAEVVQRAGQPEVKVAPSRSRRGMKPAGGLLVVAIVALALAACGSSGNGGGSGGSNNAGSGKPAYCSQVDALKQSVKALGNINVVQNGTKSVKAALQKVENNANAAIAALKSDFSGETSALSSSINKLRDSVSQLSSSPATAVAAIPGEISAVATAATNLVDSTKSRCN